MLFALNPPPAGITKLIEASQHKAAKFIKDSATGDMIYWPAEVMTHAQMAAQFGMTNYEKGLAVISEEIETGYESTHSA